MRHRDNEQGTVVCCPSEMNGAAHGRSKWPEGCLRPALQTAQGPEHLGALGALGVRDAAPHALAQPQGRLFRSDFPQGGFSLLSCSQVTTVMGRTAVQYSLW